MQIKLLNLKLKDQNVISVLPNNAVACFSFFLI